MNHKTSVNKTDSVATPPRLQGSVAKLRKHLQNLIVRDAQGNVVGQVRDLVLTPDGNLNLVVATKEAENKVRFLGVSTKFIQKIEPASQSLFINLSAAEINQLPEYERRLRSGAAAPGAAANQKNTSSKERMNMAQLQQEEALNNYMDHHQISAESAATETENLPETVDEYQIRLLEERLMVDRHKRKVGEVIVRKTVETKIIEVPVRREKLIVEQISPEQKQLAEIDLETDGNQTLDFLQTTDIQRNPVVSGEFTNAQTAARLLDAIATEPGHKPRKVKVEIVLEDSEDLAAYQQWFARYSTSPDLWA